MTEGSGLTPEFTQLLVESFVETKAKQERAAEKWGLGSSREWSADLAQGTITFDFPDYTLHGRCQFLGSYAPEASTWLWGWANESIPAPMRHAALQVRALAERPGLELLAEPKVGVRADIADDFASIAVEVAGLDGWYRVPAARSNAYLGFTGFDVEPHD
ncbi:hypothetical protein GCM10010988_25690 [Cnuibacter physcomitrellae]|uniref:Uncharacterized protein n=1 Tax=Cnuibacter physcomitrellae TaxID=1619308 RepID=A0A1X9LPU1_9MICO|nr:DUF6882 domain-containing protein [Cnuibacter physcomitrellae]ARJ03900.1 hypothetical protein B5808_00605 [Cnuibacter physcomitrellae]GGI39762.1 hypothetical protein GCM10010988_25690 [Cnuibacter physcomitrellae]